MNISLGLLLPALLGQSPVMPAAHCAPCEAKAPAYSAAMSCMPPAFQRGPYLAPSWAPPSPLCAPVAPPAPVLAMKAILPEGASLQVDGSGKAYGNGTVFGFRPGYPYRFRVDGLPGKPSESLGGSLEVHGSIIPRIGMKYMEFTAPIYITQADIDRVLAGGVVTKVIYLENPALAIPQEAKANSPLEVTTDSERSALLEAENNGRIAAVFRLGDRAPKKEELAETYLPGTILLPGETKLGKPNYPPLFGCESAIPLFDPILGPRVPSEECFPNGGDGGLKAGIGPGGIAGGLDVTDVIAEYTKGNKREVATSNVVCLCAPRFVTRRVEMGIGSYRTSFSSQLLTQVVIKSVFDHRDKVEEFVGRERTLGLATRERPSINVALTTLHALGSTTGTKIMANTEGIRLVGAVVSPEEAALFPSRLTIMKSVDPTGPYHSGDVVTMTLKYSNNTRQAITDLVISDLLSPRLEYVPGTAAAANHISTVTTSESDAGATTIRFDIPGPIRPSDSGYVVFKVKIR